MLPTSQPTLNIGYARILHNHLQDHGSQALAVFTRDDLAQIEQIDSFARFPLARWEAAMARAEELLGDPDLALRLAERIKPWTLGLLGFMMLTCRSLRDVGSVVIRFENPVNDVYRVWFDDSPAHYVMRLKPNAPNGSQRLKVLIVGSWAWQCRWLTGRSDLVFDAGFDMPQPADLSLYQRSFGGRLCFDAPDSWMAGAQDYLRLPVVQADSGIHHILREQALEKLKFLVDSSENFLARVERLVKARVGQGRVSLEDVAAEIGLSPRTLQSRLTRYGVNFRSLVDGVRLTQAESCLRDEHQTLLQISERLGFTTQASFQHAFKRWTGRTPGEYRRGDRGPDDHTSRPA